MANAIKTDSSGPYFTRDPRSRLQVTIDWSAWLEREGTTIAASVWTAEGTIIVDGETSTATLAKCYVSGGTAGTTCVIRNTITTASGSVDSRSIRVICADR